MSNSNLIVSIHSGVSKLNGGTILTVEDIKLLNNTIEALSDVCVQFRDGPDPHYYKGVVLDEMVDYKHNDFERVIRTFKAIGLEITMLNCSTNHYLTFVRVRTSADGVPLEPLIC